MAQISCCGVAGGWSPEREISLISGQKCTEALQRSGYQVTQIDVDRDLAARLTELAPMFASMRFTG